MVSIPPQKELIEILFSEEACFEFLLDKNIIYFSKPCPACNTDMKLQKKQRCLRCPNYLCRKQESVFKGTFFSKTKLRCDQIMNLAYHWLSGSTHKQLSIIGGHSSATITAFTDYFKQLLSNNLDEENSIIGGENVIIEVDESKLAKRKFNRGHHVEGVWVIGGVELTTERRIFICIIQDRSAETIKRIIYDYVRPGTIIRTDFWKGYNWISQDENYIHQKVNHSKHFKDPDTDVHTNTIEGTWSAIKKSIPSRNRTTSNIGDSLLCFIWRRINNANLWNSFLNALSDFIETD